MGESFAVVASRREGYFPQISPPMEDVFFKQEGETCVGVGIRTGDISSIFSIPFLFLSVLLAQWVLACLLRSVPDV